MSSSAEDPVLYIVACGGRAGSDLPGKVPGLQAQGWRVCVVATPSGRQFLDVETLGRLTGHVVRYEYKQPDQPDVLPPADAFAVAPATFNTINKLAAGISDTLALGLLHEGLCLDRPIVAVPTPNQALARHPVFQASIHRLREWGVRLVFDPDKYPLPMPNMGPTAADLFPWQALLQELAQVRTAVPE